MTLSPILLEKLACPACKNKLDYDEPNSRLVCRKCLLSYRIENEIPVLLVEEAEKLK
jgi:uncharacterized protein YbaR (Trm112 family)